MIVAMNLDITRIAEKQFWRRALHSSLVFALALTTLAAPDFDLGTGGLTFASSCGESKSEENNGQESESLPPATSQLSRSTLAKKREWRFLVDVCVGHHHSLRTASVSQHSANLLSIGNSKADTFRVPLRC